MDDPISHCLAGNFLPGTGKTHLARTIVARLSRAGKAVHLVSKTHCSAQNLGLGAQTADHWVRRYVRGGSAWWRRSRSWTWRSGQTWPVWG